jgi:preprotein translocase subunit SecA
VIYKKESFEKYQALLDTIHTTTVIGISNIDFEQVAQRISAAQEEYQSSFSITDQNDTTEENIIEKLKSASKDIPQNNPNNNEK